MMTNLLKFRVFTIISICIVLSADMSAQKKQLSLEELNFGGKNYRELLPKNPTMTWWGNILIEQEREKCYIVNKKNRKKTVFLTIEKINSILKQAGLNDINSLTKLQFPYPNKTQSLFIYNKKRILLDWEKKKIIWSQNIPDNIVTQDFTTSTKSLVFVKEHNLFVLNNLGVMKQLTSDGSSDIVYGQSVHRDEFGIYKGTFWSKNGKKLAFYRMDQSMVASYPLVNINTRIATLEPIKYPMAGETSHKVSIGVYDADNNKILYLKTGDPTNKYFTNITFSPDSKNIYLIEINRQQKDFYLDVYSATTGEKIKRLYSEHSDKYVHPTTHIEFLPWDETKFILQSEKSGYNHIYLFSKEGVELKQLTSGNWVVLDILGFNNKTKDIIYTSTANHPIQHNIYSVNVENRKIQALDNGEGVHAIRKGKELSHGIVLSENGEWLIDYYTEPTVPCNIDIINSSNKKRILYHQAENTWSKYEPPIFSMGQIKAADGITDLYYRMVKPTNFSSNKKYPTIVYVYGGPGVRNVEARWHYASRGWETYMASKGYIIFILDNRGSSNRGRDFEQATYHNLGVEEVKDQMCGIEYLKSLSYVDSTRIGVHGWSFGGFMTTRLMTTHPEIFKVGVAGGPVIDWKWYEAMYGERYMGTPKENPDGYTESSLIPLAKKLKGKLQIITGMNDPVVVPQHCLNFIQECIKNGTQPDFFVYPGEGHNMLGRQSVHLHKRITQYFEDYLK